MAEANVAQLKRPTDLLQAAVLKKQKEQVKATTESLQQTVDAVPQSLRALAEQNVELRQRRLNELDGTEGQAIADQIGITLNEHNGTDIDSLDEQGRQTAIVFASLLWFIGLAAIWSDLIPALAFFDDVSIGSVGTGENIESVSLLDLIYSVLCVVLMIYATGAIPRSPGRLPRPTSPSPSHNAICMSRYSVMTMPCCRPSDAESRKKPIWSRSATKFRIKTIVDWTAVRRQQQ